MQVNEAIELWKKLGIERGNMEFSCGGDCMNDYNFEFFDENDNNVESEELVSYFDNAVFDRVDFYVNSDGHYMGESGNVQISLDDDEEEDFSYYKDAESEWHEQFTEYVNHPLTKEQYDFIKTNIENINGEGSWTKNVNYKVDCILSDENEAMIDELLGAIGDMADNCDIEGSYGAWI